MSDLLSQWHVDPVLRCALRSGLAVLVLAAAAHKLRDFPSFVAAVDRYAIVGSGRSRVAAAVLVALEIGVGGSLVLGGASPLPAMAVAALFGVYTLAIAINLWRGRHDVACGCGGPVDGVPIGPSLVVRNLVLMAAAVVAAVPATARTMTGLDAVTVLGLLVTCSIAYATVETALANGAKLRHLTARREAVRLGPPFGRGEQA